MRKGPKRHHQVPVFYLRRFATDDRLVVRTRGGKCGTAGLRDAAVQEHFYSYLEGDGTRANDVEVFLAEDIDSPSAPIFDRLVKGNSTPGDWTTLTRFMAFQVARSPRFRDLEHKIAASVGPIMFGMEVLSRTFGPEGSEEWNEQSARGVFELARAHPPPPYTAKPDSNSSVRVMLRQAEQLIHDFSSLEWAIARAEAPAFITSDNPVGIFRPIGDPAAFHGVGPDDTSEVRFPLDPRHLLVGTKYSLGFERFEASDEMVQTTNALLARTCNHAIFYTPGFDRVGDVRLAPEPPPLLPPRIEVKYDRSVMRTETRFPDLDDPRLVDLVERTQL
jgi:hypothetical protein